MESDLDSDSGGAASAVSFLDDTGLCLDRACFVAAAEDVFLPDEVGRKGGSAGGAGARALNNAGSVDGCRAAIMGSKIWVEHCGKARGAIVPKWPRRVWHRVHLAGPVLRAVARSRRPS